MCIDLYRLAHRRKPPNAVGVLVYTVRTEMEAALVEFGLRTGSGRLFHEDGLSNGKSPVAFGLHVESVMWYEQLIFSSWQVGNNAQTSMD